MKSAGINNLLRIISYVILFCLCLNSSILYAQFKTGDDLLSVFSITREKGTELKYSADIPDKFGNMQKGKGFIRIVTTYSLDGKLISSTPDDGIIWTPIVEKIGEIDLSILGNITEQPGFNFKAYKDNKKVIPFKNGYAINLFAAELKSGEILGHKGEKSYVAKDGQRLPGRLIEVEVGKDKKKSKRLRKSKEQSTEKKQL